METSPLSPNWPIYWSAPMMLLLSPLNAYVLPRVSPTLRFAIAAVLSFGVTFAAVLLTPLEMSELFVQAGIIFGMVSLGYQAARSGTGLVSGIGAGALGIGASAGAVALLLPAAFAQPPDASIAEAAKEAARGQIMWWLSWTLATFGGWIGRKLDTHPSTIPSLPPGSVHQGSVIHTTVTETTEIPPAPPGP